MKRKAIREENQLVWIHLGTTGLDPKKDVIVGVECVITDSNLTHISPYFQANVHFSAENILKINPALKHTAILCSESPYTLQNIEDTLIQFIRERVVNLWTLAGVNLSTKVLFLNKYLPNLALWLDSRTVNVDTVRELCWIWNPGLYCRAPARKKNMSLSEAIDELRWYRDHLFIKRRLLTAKGPQIKGLS